MANTIIVTTKKVTKIDNYTEIKGFIPEDRTDLIEFIDSQIEQTRKKNSYKSANAKPSAKSQANAKFRDEILDYLSTQSEPVLAKTIASVFGVPTQSVASNLSILAKADKVASAKVKGVNVWYIPNEEEPTE